MMKKKKNLVLLGLSIFAITTAAFAYSYDTNLPLPGKSLASRDLQAETLFPVYSYAHRVAPADCTVFSITDTEVSKPKTEGSWEEIWTIKACTTTARLPIIFSEGEGKPSYALDPMNVKVTK